MSKDREAFSASGVRISEDYRDNLIVDRYHPCFVSMRQSKKTHLKSENSEDAISWNVFRSLRQIKPDKWVNLLFEKAFRTGDLNGINDTTISLWHDVSPPPALLKTGDEGISEIDIVLENPEWVLFIEAKYKSDISEGTTTRPDNRDQILRNIDVGSYYAGVRNFYFAFLYLDEKRSPKGISAVEKYQNLELLQSVLPHRKDGLQNLRGIGMLTWNNLAEILKTASDSSELEDEQVFADRAINWLKEKKIYSSQDSL